MKQSAEIYYPDFRAKDQPSDTRIIEATLKVAPTSLKLKILNWILEKEVEYVLEISEVVYPVIGERRQSLPQRYTLAHASDVKSQIFWKIGRLSSKGYLRFYNETFEPDTDFIEPEWLNPVE